MSQKINDELKLFYKEIINNFYFLFYQMTMLDIKCEPFAKSYQIEICNLFQKVYNGEIKNLIINASPRSAKSSLVKNFVFGGFIRNPLSNFILTSYSSHLIKSHSLAIMENVKEYGAEYGLELNPLEKSKGLFSIKDGGKLYATSVGGAVTGFQAGNKSSRRFSGAIIIDDPVKVSERNSPIVRQNLEDWYVESLLTRKDGHHVPIILIMQRLTKNDFTDFLMSRKKEGWVKYEVKSLVNGKSFFEEIITTEELENMKKIDKYKFYSQYQQEPLIQGGNTFKDYMFKKVNYNKMPLQYDYTFISADTAFTKKNTSSFSVFGSFGVIGDDIYLIDMIKFKEEWDALEDRARGFYAKNAIFPFKGMFIENKASGISLIQSLSSDGLMVNKIELDKNIKDQSQYLSVDKWSRALTMLPYFKKYPLHIGLKDDDMIKDVLDEMTSFSADGENDDIVDTIVYAYMLIFKNFYVSKRNLGRIRKRLKEVAGRRMRIDNYIMEL